MLVPVGADHLLTADTPGCRSLVLPTGIVNEGETPEQAAQSLLEGTPGGLPGLRRVAVDQVQMQRRKIITYFVVTQPLTRLQAATLIYRIQSCASNPRRKPSPTFQTGRVHEHSCLQARAIGAMAYAQDGTVQRLVAVFAP